MSSSNCKRLNYILTKKPTPMKKIIVSLIILIGIFSNCGKKSEEMLFNSDSAVEIYYN